MFESKLIEEFESALALFRRSKFADHTKGFRNSEKFTLLLISKLSKDKDVTPSDLAKHMCVTMPAITHQINSLENQGLIKRKDDPNDRRIVSITIQKKGQKVLADIKKKTQKKIVKLVKGLGAEDTQELIRIIKKIVDIVNSEEKSA